MTLFLQLCCLGKCSDISFIDSTSLRVCHIKRQKAHKRFDGWTAKGKSTIGWFYGFKLHMIINDKGEILDLVFTQAHVDDRTPLKSRRFHKHIFGKKIRWQGIYFWWSVWTTLCWWNTFDDQNQKEHEELPDVVKW